ncbi:hypothetical protein B0H19DRAFT_1380989 [Mycena capillaripes]|nr:hypothetical protein B0H19DRAFT_1380989 [Mycena capillaripes]
MHLTLCLLVAFWAKVIFALSPLEIIASLDDLTGQANRTTILLDKVPSSKGSSIVLESKALLDQVTTDYVTFYLALTADLGPVVLDQTVSDQTLQAAEIHSKAFSVMGIALARALPTYNEYGYYVAGCKDGVTIGLDAIALFIDLGLKFPFEALAFVLNGLLTDLRVPLKELSAVGCFVPFLGPLPVV